MIYIPGDPRTTMYVKQIMVIASVVARKTVMYVTAQHWRLIAAELDAQYMDSLVDPKGPIPWRISSEFRIGKVTVVNAGTENEQTVNRMNEDTPGAVDYIDRREALRIA